MLAFEIVTGMAVFVRTWIPTQGEVDMLLREGIFTGRDSLEMTLQDRNYQLVPLRVVEAGEDFCWARFKVKKQSA